jgi:hypothetical protein
MTSAPLGIQLVQNHPTSEINSQFPVQIKNEKMESTVHLSFAELKPEKGCSVATPTARLIDRRRDEVNEQTNSFGPRMSILTRCSSYSVQRKRSSSTTTLELAANNDVPSSLSNNLCLVESERDVTESKSFIPNLDLNTGAQRETNE